MRCASEASSDYPYSRLSLEDKKSDMKGTVGSKRTSLLEMWEEDAVLTKTITYTLPKGTYYVYLRTSSLSYGTEYTLEFSAQYQLPKPT